MIKPLPEEKFLDLRVYVMQRTMICESGNARRRLIIVIEISPRVC